jgi:nucleoside-diphosphate-sugar epimerase
MFFKQDLRDKHITDWLISSFMPDEVYQFAADMGGAGFVFTGENDADIMHNSSLINLNILKSIQEIHSKIRIFYSSSACIYPQECQTETDMKGLKETMAYPANPDSEYGWEKIFSERLYLAFRRNYGIDSRIARFHNIFGPEGTWKGGREKAPAAICRKIASISSDGIIDIWGDGEQTRSFLYISECIEGVRRLMKSDIYEPINIGSDEMVSINRLVEMVGGIAGKTFSVNHINGPQGVRGRNSENTLIYNMLGWKPSMRLYDGLIPTYKWIEKQVQHEIVK